MAKGLYRRTPKCQRPPNSRRPVRADPAEIPREVRHAEGVHPRRTGRIRGRVRRPRGLRRRVRRLPRGPPARGVGGPQEHLPRGVPRDGPPRRPDEPRRDHEGAGPAGGDRMGEGGVHRHGGPPRRGRRDAPRRGPRQGDPGEPRGGAREAGGPARGAGEGPRGEGGGRRPGPRGS